MFPIILSSAVLSAKADDFPERVPPLEPAVQTAQPESAAVARVSQKVEGRWVHGVVARMDSGLVAARVVHAPRLTAPWTLISQNQPKAALTGTFFAWETQQPVADVLVEGSLVSQGRRGSIVAVDWDGRVNIFDARFGAPVDWSPYRYALRGAVRLISQGVVNPNPRAQQFRDRRIWGKAARTGIGLSADGQRLIMAATASPVTLSQFGRMLKQLGAANAVSLDGGGSTMLYTGGRMVVRTSRRLSTLFVLDQRSPFEAAAQSLR